MKEQVRSLKQKLSTVQSQAKDGIDIESEKPSYKIIDETFYKDLFDKMQAQERQIVNSQETFKLKNEISTPLPTIEIPSELQEKSL